MVNQKPMHLMNKNWICTSWRILSRESSDRSQSGQVLLHQLLQEHQMPRHIRPAPQEPAQDERPGQLLWRPEHQLSSQRWVQHRKYIGENAKELGLQECIFASLQDVKRSATVNASLASFTMVCSSMAALRWTTGPVKTDLGASPKRNVTQATSTTSRLMKTHGTTAQNPNARKFMVRRLFVFLGYATHSRNFLVGLNC